MQEGGVEGLLGSATWGGDVGRSRRGGSEVVQRLGDTPEDQTDPHTGREQHGEPAEHAVLRLFVVLAEADVAKPAEGGEDRERNEAEHDDDVVPAQAVDDRRVGRADDRVELAGEHRRGDDEGQNEAGGGDQYPVARVRPLLG